MQKEKTPMKPMQRGGKGNAKKGREFNNSGRNKTKENFFYLIKREKKKNQKAHFLFLVLRVELMCVNQKLTYLDKDTLLTIAGFKMFLHCWFWF